MRTTLPNGEGIRWPEGKQVAVMLTFDFDADCLQIARFAGSEPIFADTSRGLYGPDEGIWRCLRMLKEQQVNATFFVPGVICERYPDQVQAIAQGGHEIAYHGYRHDANAVHVHIKDARESMAKAETLIEKVWGRRPVGCRLPGGYTQPYTIDLIRERGYKYSSALTPEISCDWAYVYKRNGKPIPVVELSTDVMTEDFPYYFFSLCHPQHKTPYNNDYVREIWQSEFDGRRAEGDKILCLKLHPSLIGRASRIRMLGELVAYMKDNGAWIATCEQVADYVLEYNGVKA